MNVGYANTVVSLTIGAGVIISGAIAAFFLIRTQLTKVLREEVAVYKEKVERLSDEIHELRTSIQTATNDNLALVSERDYLRNLIISALTTKDTVHVNILEEALNKIDKKRIISQKD